MRSYPAVFLLATVFAAALRPFAACHAQVDGRLDDAPATARSAGTWEDWRLAAQEKLLEIEYHVTCGRATQADLLQSYHAPNRAQNFRTCFTADGIRVFPRTQRKNMVPAWEWGLQASSWGRAGEMHPVAPAVITTNGNRVEYARGEIVEWYVNDPRGLEQGFSIDVPPRRSSEREATFFNCSDAPLDSGIPTLCLDFSVTGDVAPTMNDDRQSVDFITPRGKRVIHFGELHAVDAAGTPLPAWFEIEGNCLALLIGDAGAIYPITIDPLATSPAWTAESDQENARFGSCVSAAGDVNGDGFGDVIVAAPYFDNAQGDGRVFVYHGSVAGLSAAPNWTAASNLLHVGWGLSVSTAGDVNGDGYSDVIVGAPDYGNTEISEGRASVYHGSASGLSATPDWTAYGNQMSAQFGYSVATAGDVNGDGYSDVIVGAPYFNNGQTGEGKIFVYYGSAAGLPAAPDWTTESDQTIAQIGRSVATAGDVNGDGYSDVIVGSPFFDNGQTDEGRAFVYHGSASGLSAGPAWTAESDQTNAWFGYSVSTAGDVNGDGYSDVIVGAYLYDHGHVNEGRAFIFHGSTAGLSATSHWVADINQANAHLGFSVASAGDVNGDGYGDVIVGARDYNNGQTDEGRALVYYGSVAGTSAVPNWDAEADQAFANFGNSVATAGDVNNDGYDDVIVGSLNYDNGHTDEGRAFVYHLMMDSCSSPGDMNCDCALNFEDVAVFVEALLDPVAYTIGYPACNIHLGDMQPDGKIDGADVQEFADLLVP